MSVISLFVGYALGITIWFCIWKSADVRSVVTKLRQRNLSWILIIVESIVAFGLTGFGWRWVQVVIPANLPSEGSYQTFYLGSSWLLGVVVASAAHIFVWGWLDDRLR